MGWEYGALNGSGPQEVMVYLDYVSYNQAGNYSTWDWEVRYRGNNSQSWILDGNTWSMSGFATSSGSFQITSSNAGGDIVLGSGRFNKTHNADGYLAAGTLTASINTNHTSIGDGSASVSSGTPPRIPKKPDAPSTPTFSTVTHDGMKVAWSVADNGGSPITGYTLQWSTSSSFASVTGSVTTTATSYTVTGLDPVQTYYWRVNAKNAIGTSSYSATGTRATVAGPPDTPAAPVISLVGASSMRVSWTAPESNGATITSYDVQWSTSSTFSGAPSASDTDSPFDLTGLSAATTYYVRIRAINSAGTSAWSAYESGKTLSAVFYIDPATNVAEVVELYAWTGSAYVPVELYLDPELDGTYVPAG